MPRYRSLLTLLVASICVVSFMTLWLGALGEQQTPIATLVDTVGSKTDSSYANAHTFDESDKFWPHFENVFRLKPVTMKEAKAGCAWKNVDDVNFQFAAEQNAFVDTEWVVNDTSDAVVDKRRSDWQEFMMHGTIPYGDVADQLSGRGIVVVGGLGQSFHRIKVLLRQLKRLGSSMPVEIHYWNDEMTESKILELMNLWPHIALNDLSSPSLVYKTQLEGLIRPNYQLKTAAILNSNFAEILLMDSDNIPTIPPEQLFESETYAEYGTVFWPDIARTRANDPIWAITNTPCRTDEYEQESGQALIDKRKFWYHLQLAMFFINHENSPYYNNIILGDKDTFRFAWHALKTHYGRPAHWLASVGTNINDTFCGHHFAQFHPDRNDSRVAFMHGGLLKTMDKSVMAWHRKSNGGVFQAYKTGASPFDPADMTKVGIKLDGVGYMPDRPEGLGGQMCTDLRETTARPFEELVEGFNEVFEDVGGYWLIDSKEFNSGT
ncbi:glycosyltransferase family 71 protein [Dothistroma septosporum NZE10]|uniref:Glycosyltransferase family 71 protein n=1 Tax=Dothistroma septosporum (strain NZE10 / CBS 128990) TaxID=675120 RepID=N1PWU4_DOTSN|nr:glycosyltransferase family 71 protein [Dothistroma septosporum NZE10]